MSGTEPSLSAGAAARRAFIIDDDGLTRQMLGALVEKSGFVAVEVTPIEADIADAVAAASPEDVLILDIILGPDLDGFEVIRMLGKAGFKGRLIVVSGFSPDYLQTLESLATALSIRVAGALEKPVRAADLQRCLLG